MKRCASPFLFDSLYGGYGDDTLLGGGGADYLTGDDGSDYLYQSDESNANDFANDTIYGGSGQDYGWYGSLGDVFGSDVEQIFM